MDLRPRRRQRRREPTMCLAPQGRATDPHRISSKGNEVVGRAMLGLSDAIDLRAIGAAVHGR
jgi:hypothetical protein